MALVPRGYTAQWEAVPGTGWIPGQDWKPSQYIREYTWGGGGAYKYKAPSITLPDFGGGDFGKGDFGSMDMPEYQTPEYPTLPGYDLPEYQMPEYDLDKVSSLRQQEMAPMMRGIRNMLREQMLQVPARYGRGSYMSTVARSKLLAGSGAAIESASTAARRNALAQYAAQYRAEADKASAIYGGGLQRAGALYQGGLQSASALYQGGLERAGALYQGGVQSAMFSKRAGLEMATTRFSAEAAARRSTAQMEHDARMAELTASLRY